ncbi:NlpC/P60 family protein [Glycocaulis sp.]|uniref:NlpC/P60 family protein n=1 Tax=Glycocaulis sp. TaxID=1969725 RepID=UPI003D24615F
MSANRAAIIAEAREWIGTPYRHQASCKGAGTDCLGLVRGVWRACVGPEPETLPAYSPDWAERSGEDTLLAALNRHFAPREIDARQPGDVLLFHTRAGGPSRHCAILSTPHSIIHAWQGRAVAETPLDGFWMRRISAVAAFPIPD